MPGAPIRRKRREAREKLIREEAARLALMQHGILPEVSEAPPPPISHTRPATASTPAPKSDDVLALAPPEKLAELVELALMRAGDILKIKLDPLHADFIKLAAIQQSTLAAVLGTQARADPGKLRGAQHDRMGELLDRLRGPASSETSALSPT